MEDKDKGLTQVPIAVELILDNWFDPMSNGLVPNDRQLTRPCISRSTLKVIQHLLT